MTMLELVLVMFLLALVLGGGVGLFAALDLGKRQAAGLVRNVLRSAQNTAIASSAPARVRIDKKTGTCVAESMVAVGTYHFEGGSTAGYGPLGKSEPEWFDEHGFMGGCFHPAGQRGATLEIPIAEDPAFDLRRGFALDLALLRESSAGGRVLSIGTLDPYTLALDLGPNGDLRATFRARVGEAESDRAGGKVVVHTAPELVPVGRWIRVRVQYDRRNFQILLDGARVGSEPESSYVWDVDGPLTLSDRVYPFPGKLDALVIHAMVAGEPARLPETVQFTADTSEVVEFAPGGALDRRVHKDPPRIGLEYRDGTRTFIEVGTYGSVE